MPDLCGIDVLYQFVVCSYNGVIVHMVCGTVWCIGVVSVCGVCGVLVYRCISVVNQCVVRTYGVAQLPPSHKSSSSCSLDCE